MSNFFVEIISGGKSYNAGYKLINDLNRIMEQRGYTPLKCRLQTGKGKFTKLRCLLSDVAACLRAMGKDATVLYLYPDILYYDFLFPLLRWKRHRKIAIIIDINSLREGDGKLSGKDRKNLLRYDTLIVHTPAMKQLLIENGFESGRLEVMHMFDYLTDIPNRLERENGNTICYTGNLNKSDFLAALPEEGIKGITFNLYGAESKNIKTGEHVVYKGKFEPGNLGRVEGNWGLVWDGTALDTCSGAYGNYLKVNLPHKTCLYTAAQLPVIIWEKAAMAPFIQQQGIGIAVKSIREIPEKTAAVTNEQYALMFANIKRLSRELNEGNMLGKFLG